jgi:hypothetical protein
MNMSQSNIRQVFISIFVGACVAFISAFLDGLAAFIRDHSQELIAGMSTSMVYIAKAYKA